MAPPPGQGTVAPAATPASRMAMVRAVLAVVVIGLTVLSLAVEEEDGVRGYEDWTSWAIFATVMAAVHLLPLFSPLDEEKTWLVVAGATAGLVLYWVAIVLPNIKADLSFAQTMAVVLAVAHLWLLPGRRV